MIFVHMGSVAQGAEFFETRWPEVGAISDRDRDLYAAFGLRRGSLLSLLGPQVWKAGFNALREGHGVGRPVGDPFMLSGSFLIVNDTIVEAHRHAHPGEDRDWVDWARRVRALRG